MIENISQYVTLCNKCYKIHGSFLFSSVSNTKINNIMITRAAQLVLKEKVTTIHCNTVKLMY